MSRRASEILQVTRQLATLIRLDFPLHEGLKKTQGPRWLGDLAEDLESGDEIVQAMARRPRLFSQHYRTLVEAALDSKDPVKGLEQLGLWLERSLQIQHTVRSALLYPLVLLVLALILGSGFLLFLVPDIAVPLAEIQEFNWLAFLLTSRLFLLVLFGLGFGTLVWILLPPLRRVIRLADQALWARGLATLLAAGHPLLDALVLLQPAIRDRGLVGAFQNLTESVKKGGSLSELLRTESEFHSLLQWCGTQSKKQDDLTLALFHSADSLESELEGIWRQELAAAEPRLMVGAGMAVGLVLLIAWVPVIWAGSGTWI